MFTRLNNLLSLPNFIQVLIANSFAYLITFCASVIYARLLLPHDFGIYSFCYSIITFFLLLNGFGAASGVLQFVSTAKTLQLQLGYLYYAFKIGILFNFILCVLIILYANFFSFPVPESKIILISMSFFPLGRLYIDIMLAFLRASKKDHLLAKFSISSNLLLLILGVLGIYLYKLNGLIIGTYISYLLIFFIATYVYKLPNILKKNTTNIQSKHFIKYSIYATIGNAFSQILFVIDILILSFLIHDAKLIASYKVATIIPFALNFIPGIIMTYFYPEFAKNVNNKVYIKNLQLRVQKIMLIISAPIAIILIIIAKPLITIIFGKYYIKSILPFQILIFGFIILACFRIPLGNILASLGKTKFTMYINLFIAAINITLAYYLIKNYTMLGAAINLIITYTIASLMLWYTLKQQIK